MELICSVSLIAKPLGILEDEDDSSNSEFRLKVSVQWDSQNLGTGDFDLNASRRLEVKAPTAMHPLRWFQCVAGGLQTRMNGAHLFLDAPI
jgi:hypothetical protein